MSAFKKYWLYTFLGVLLLSVFPIYMGIDVIYNDIVSAVGVPKGNFPKYIIPFMLIAFSVVVAVAVMPLVFKLFKRRRLLAGTAVAVCVFFITELSLSCLDKAEYCGYIYSQSMQLRSFRPPEYREVYRWAIIDSFSRSYSIPFKLHFYIGSLVLIASITNCLYGFAQIISGGNKARRKVLVVQAVSSVLLLVVSCLTGFFPEEGYGINVPPLPAVLISLFIIALSVTVGVYAASLLLGSKKKVSVLIPSVAASLAAFALYICEICLLCGLPYRLGTSFIFKPVYGIALAPIDIIIIAASGLITAIISNRLNKPYKKSQ